MRGLIVVLLSVALVGLAPAVAFAQGGATQATTQATTQLTNASGAAVGQATFTQTSDGVRVQVNVTGLPPGTHGIHVHEVGRCDPPDFTSAGGHYNPEGRQHGLENPQGPHAGDLPNLEIAADGSGTLTAVNPRLSLQGGAAPLLDSNGSALVVHTGADDQRSDPSGNSGARIACGVITLASQPTGLPQTGGPIGERWLAVALGGLVIGLGLLMRRMQRPV